MSETSYLWTTGGGGDAGASITRLDWAWIARIISACHNGEGIAPGILGEGMPSIYAANTLRIGSCLAMVDGHPYVNNTNLDITIPSAVGVGNTRIDRVVMLANWSAQTVRLVRVPGTDAVSPVVPVNPYTSTGTSYAILIAAVKVNTSGTLSNLIDERTLAFPTNIPASCLAAFSITTGQISHTANILGTQLSPAANILGSQLSPAANIEWTQLKNPTVTTANLGAYIPVLVARNGPDDYLYNLPGDTPGLLLHPRMSCGVTSLTIPAGSSYAEKTINFPFAYTNGAPLVICSLINAVTEMVVTLAYGILDDRFIMRATRAGTSGNTTVNISWFAIGPEPDDYSGPGGG